MDNYVAAVGAEGRSQVPPPVRRRPQSDVNARLAPTRHVLDDQVPEIEIVAGHNLSGTPITSLVDDLRAVGRPSACVVVDGACRVEPPRLRAVAPGYRGHVGGRATVVFPVDHRAVGGDGVVVAIVEDFVVVLLTAPAPERCLRTGPKVQEEGTVLDRQ